MKKRNLLFTLAASTLLLSSCGKISAQFEGGDNTLVNVGEGITLDHNTLNVIYDAIKNSDTYESDVNSILTEKLAQAVIGEFKIVANSENAYGFDVQLVGYDVKEDGSATDEATKTSFIESHPAYNNWDYSGYKLTLKTESPSASEFEARLNSIKGIIRSQVISTLWGEANVTDYKRNNRFYEVLYAKNIYEQLYTINVSQEVLGENVTLRDALYKNPTYDNHYHYVKSEEKGDVFQGFYDLEAELYAGNNDHDATLHGFTNGVLIDGSYNTNTDEGREKIAKVLHFGYYTDYINEAILPDIVENLLVEQYIFEEQYSAIGNTQTRRINYIAIADNTEKNGKAFAEKFVQDYILNPIEEIKGLSTEEKFEIASDAWKGIDYKISENANATTLATGIFGEGTLKNPSAGLDGHVAADSDEAKNGYKSYYQNYGDDVATNEKYFKYYENTEYATLVEEYSTLTNSSTTNNSTNYDKFTTIDSINYDPIVGFTIQADSIAIKDFTTNGWQTRDASTLPDAIKNKLYSYGLASEWNTSLTSDDPYLGSYLYQAEAKEGENTVRRTYLRKDSFTSTVDSLIWLDSDTYYIVEIEDIVTPNLVAIESDSTDKVARENKARTVGYTLASGDTYTTNAITHYLAQCNINYHDQDVYDYFVTTYPDLFE